MESTSQGLRGLRALARPCHAWWGSFLPFGPPGLYRAQRGGWTLEKCGLRKRSGCRGHGTAEIQDSGMGNEPGFIGSAPPPRFWLQDPTPCSSEHSGPFRKPACPSSRQRPIGCAGPVTEKTGQGGSSPGPSDFAASFP